MKPILFAMAWLLSFSLLSCNTKTSTVDKQAKKERITQLEEQLFKVADGVADKKAAAEMIDAYQDYADSFPQDSLSPHYLFRAADISLNVFHSDATIRLFDKIMTSYPQFEGVGHILFFKAFTYDYYLNQKEEAAIYYHQFLKQHPKHPFAKDAEISLQQLGKSPEEVLKEFTNKAND